MYITWPRESFSLLDLSLSCWRISLNKWDWGDKSQRLWGSNVSRYAGTEKGDLCYIESNLKRYQDMHHPLLSSLHIKRMKESLGFRILVSELRHTVHSWFFSWAKDEEQKISGKKLPVPKHFEKMIYEICVKFNECEPQMFGALLRDDSAWNIPLKYPKVSIM